MKVIIYSLLLLQISLWHKVKCQNQTSCNSTVSIKCNDGYVIAIIDVAGNLAPYLLEQCNARQICEAPIMDKQCANLRYWCKMRIATLETKKSSITQIQTIGEQKSGIGLMSEGYADGTYQSAENINCTIKTTAQHRHQLQMKVNFILNDFASFSNFKEYCLSMQDSTQPPFCSGSQKYYYTSYGPFTVENERPFSIELAINGTNTTQVPQLRFWFEIHISTENVLIDNVECHSKPAEAVTEKNSSKPLVNKGNKLHAIILALGTLLGLAVFTIICGIGRFIYRPSEQPCKQPEVDDHIYCDIDLPVCTMVPYNADTSDRMVPDISVARQLVEVLRNDTGLMNSIPDLCSDLPEGHEVIKTSYKGSKKCKVAKDTSDEIEIINDPYYDPVIQDTPISDDMEIVENPYYAWHKFNNAKSSDDTEIIENPYYGSETFEMMPTIDIELSEADEVF